MSLLSLLDVLIYSRAMDFALENPTVPPNPRKPRQNEKFQVEVVHNRKSDVYLVTLGRLRGDGVSLAEALHQLANQIDASGAYGAMKVQIMETAARKSRECKYCGASIFFGKTEAGRWVPLDTEQMPAEALGEAVRAAVFIDGFNGPVVRFAARAQGRVWVPHPDVCGANAKQPESPQLKERWLERRRVSDDTRKATAERLRAIREELEGERRDPDAA